MNNELQLFPCNKQVYNRPMRKQQDPIIILLHTNAEIGLKKLIAEYSGYVHTIVKSKLSAFSMQDIEECVSDVFYSVYKSKDSISEARGSLKAFVCTVAKRKAIDFLRKKRLDTTTLPQDFDTLAAKDDVAKSALEYEEKTALLQAINLLEEADRQIIVRRFYFGQSHKEIAKALAMNENTVSKRSARAVEKLNQILVKEGYVNERE